MDTSRGRSVQSSASTMNNQNIEPCPTITGMLLPSPDLEDVNLPRRGSSPLLVSLLKIHIKVVSEQLPIEGQFVWNLQWDKALDKIKWKMSSFKASIYKSWPKKESTPKVAFRDHPKPKVKKKGRLITNQTRCFKCNGMGHIAINHPTKRTLVLSEDLNGWIEKSNDDFQEDIVDKDERSFESKLEGQERATKLFSMSSISKDQSREQNGEKLAKSLKESTLPPTVALPYRCR
ncbi:hypothetical protein M9H77_17571 [Catharanthus roseus]|uniref:Uncharacterized protein n=1 Tax=Catharanthus roseus TaxID=4058 RepID=A0ACC0B5B9_CATRO|nr:hypothetical protein M9H77_17571 [Catharanthus roseus]